MGLKIHMLVNHYLIQQQPLHFTDGKTDFKAHAFPNNDNNIQPLF